MPCSLCTGAGERLCAVTQLRHNHGKLQTSQESTPHEPWAAHCHLCRNIQLLFTFPFQPLCRCKHSMEKSAQTQCVCTIPTTLMPRQAEHQGKAGGSKHRERRREQAQGEKENRSCKAEIKMQNKSHNRRDQEQKKQIQETGTSKLDR